MPRRSLFLPGLGDDRKGWGVCGSGDEPADWSDEQQKKQGPERHINDKEDKRAILEDEDNFFGFA